MSRSHRSANTALQRALIDVMGIVQQEETNEHIFTDNLIKYYTLVSQLQIDDPVFKSEAKSTYSDMLEYCNLNSKYLQQKFDSVSIRISSSCKPINYSWFKHINKDEDLELVEEQLKNIYI